MFRAGFTLLRRVIYAACLLILMICGAEVFVRVYEVVSGAPVSRTSDGVYGDPSKLAIPSGYFHQELKSLAVAKVECRDSKTQVEVRTNSLGLRATEIEVPKSPGTYRIVVLGDETIFAPETPDADHFCTLVQNQLQQYTRTKIEVINAAIPGHCPLTEYVLFKRLLLGLAPDMLLLHFDWSDVADDRQIRHSARCDAAGVPQLCPNARREAAKKVRTHEVWRQQFRLFDWGLSTASDEWKHQLAQQKAISRDIDANPYAWLREEHPEQNVAFRQSVRPIADMARLCQSLPCQFVLMTSPKPWQVSAKCSRGEGVRLAEGVAREACFSSREPFRVLARFAQNAKPPIPFVDGSAVLVPGQDAETNFLCHAPRWSPAGHRKMADRVASFVSETIPGPWNSPYFQPDQPQPVSRTENRENTILWMSGQQSSQRSDSRFADRQLK